MKEKIAKLIERALSGKLNREEVENLIEVPPSFEMGDFAFPCFVLASKMKKPPVQIAEGFVKKIKKTKEIDEIKSMGGYVNFFINKKILAQKVLKIDEGFGKRKQGEKILLEHTSVNPNASPHVGRVRNSIIGDSIFRILEFLGNKVERHYYVNDVSKQVAMLGLNFKSSDGFDDLLRKYVEISKKVGKNPKLEKKVFELLHKFEHKDKETTALFKKIVDTAVKGQREIFSSIGIEFEHWDYESRYISEGQKVLKELDKTGKLFDDENGRKVLNQKGTGLDMKMKTPVLVLTRSDGTGLYPLRDLAYTIEKCHKGRNILVLGEDQKLYFEQLKQALILLGKKYPEVVHYSFVLLKGAGKMSTRRGEVVLLEEFLKEAKKKAEKEIKKRKTKGDAMKIAIAAVKYAMLRNENNKNITFDLGAALNFEGETGPYLQYSYARASSILRKAGKGGGKKGGGKGEIKIPELQEKEIKLIKKILNFKDVVERAGKRLEPSMIANYSFQLAQIFNEFYHECKVIGSEGEGFRVRLVEAFRKVLKNLLWLLGIDVMDEM